MRSELHWPADPLPRFGALYAELVGRRSWFQRGDGLRHAVLLALPLEGSPEAVARRLELCAGELQRALRWTDPLRGGLRFALAATLLREELSVRELVAALDQAAPLFRRHWRWHGHAWERLAVLVLLAQSDERRVTRAAVERLAAIWQRMRVDHPWLTRKSDWPACAALVARPEPVDVLGERMERLYRGMRAQGFVRGDALQRATQILTLGADDPTGLCRRAWALYQGFRDAGLWMHRGDYDEVALLATVDAPATSVVERVLAQRAAIASLRPRPSRELAFSLACGTATYAYHAEAGGGPSALLESLARLVALLTAQEEAAAAAAGAAAAG